MNLRKLCIVIVVLLLIIMSYQTVKLKKINKTVIERTSVESLMLKNDIKNIYNYRNKKIKNIYLTSSKGKKIEMSELLNEHKSEKLLILYSPGCVCQIEKEKALFQIDSLYKKGQINNLIFIFNEPDLSKLPILKRVYKFNCPVYSDFFSGLNINNENKIFLFELCKNMKYNKLAYAHFWLNGYVDIIDLYGKPEL